MNCPACGEPVEAGADLCLGCGEPLSEALRRVAPARPPSRPNALSGEALHELDVVLAPEGAPVPAPDPASLLASPAGLDELPRSAPLPRAAPPLHGPAAVIGGGRRRDPEDDRFRCPGCGVYNTAGTARCRSCGVRFRSAD
jgi:hypothetical protein